MLNLRKSRPIKVTAYLPEALKGYPIVVKSGYDKKPWMAKSDRPYGDLTSCYGMIELQKNSIQFNIWMHINIRQDGLNINFEPIEPQYFDTQSHTGDSNGFCEREDMQIMKVIPPVSLSCDETLKWVMCPSPNAHHPFHLVSGITNLRYTKQPNFFIYFSNKGHMDYTLEPLRPLFHLVPMSERPIKMDYVYDCSKTIKVRQTLKVFAKFNAYKSARYR